METTYLSGAPPPRLVWPATTPIRAGARYLRTHTTRGQGLVEYALILVLIAIVAIGSLTMLGHRTSQVFEQVNCTLGGGVYHQDQGNGNSTKCK